MQKGSGNNGFYFSGNPVPILSYSSVGMTNTNFYNGNPNPVKVTLKDVSGNPIGSVLYLKITGRFISDTELNAITLPSISNAASLLSTVTNLVSPTINYTTNSGFVAASVNLFHGPYIGQSTGATKMILSPVSGTATIADTINVTTDTYRSLTLYSSLPGSGLIRTKYVGSPQCTGGI